MVFIVDRLPCSPTHSHNKCLEVLDDKHDRCGHSFKRKCYEDPNKIPCEIRVDIIYDKCQHPGRKKCYVDQSKLTCPKPCEKLMNCGLHPCNEICGNPHVHSECQAEVTFNFPGCNHFGKKLCFEDAEKKICKMKVDFQFEKCGHKGRKVCYEDVGKMVCQETVNDRKPGCDHEVQRKCHQSIGDIACHHPCIKLMDCKKHHCPEICGSNHGHGDCRVMIKYQFPNCKHNSPKRKRCSEPITWKCGHPRKDRAKCGHMVGYNLDNSCISHPLLMSISFLGCAQMQ